MLQNIWTPWQQHGKLYTMKLVFYAIECLKYCVRSSPSSDCGVMMKEKWISRLHLGLTCKASPCAYDSTSILKRSFSKGCLTHLLFWGHYTSWPSCKLPVPVASASPTVTTWILNMPLMFRTSWVSTGSNTLHFNRVEMVLTAEPDWWVLEIRLHWDNLSGCLSGP